MNVNYNIKIKKFDTDKPSPDPESLNFEKGGDPRYPNAKASKYRVSLSRSISLEDKVLGGFAPLGDAYCDYPEDIMENVIEFLENDLNGILERRNENE